MKYNQQVLLNDGFFEDISLCLCAIKQDAPGQPPNSVIRSHYTLHYVLTGKGTISTKLSTYTLQAAEGILIPPNTYTCCQAAQNDPWQYLWIGFLGQRVPQILSSMELEYLARPFSCRFPQELESLANKMLASSKGTLDQIFFRQSLLISLLSLLTRNQPSDQKCQMAGINSYVADTIRFISRHYAEPISVYKLSVRLGITRNYLYSLFKQELHCSPQEYLSGFRLKRACELLKQTEYSIDTIANSCGYPEPAVFSKAFKKKYGQTPSQYRANP